MNTHDATEAAYKRGYIDGYMDGRRTEWISCEERLPEPRKAVLAVIWGDMVELAWYDKDDGVWQSEFISAYGEGEVTHWMPLPEPPKGVE